MKNDTYVLGTRVTPDRAFHEVFDELRSEGWRPVGDGSSTTVLLSPDGKRVLKFADGIGQTATVEAALANQGNPHFPRIFGYMDLEGTELGDYAFAYEAEAYAFAYEAEALEPLADEDSGEDDGYANPTFRAWEQRWSPTLFDRNPDLWKGRPNGPMKDAIRALGAASDEHMGYRGWDIHPGNLMVRPSDGSLVLNDLLA